MKFRILGVILLLAGSSILMIGCPGSSPSSPAAPTATPTFTNTVCMNASGTPCTSTPTFTFTDTATATDTVTDTATGTPTHTATATYTRTETGTPTDTATSTATGTPTNTATVTDTPTVTPTPTDTLSPTPTGSDTPTFTATSTVTFTPTRTATDTATATNTVFSCASTDTFTPTPSGGNSISVTVHVTGGTINASHPVFVHVDNTSLGSPTTSFEGNANILSNNGVNKFTGIPSGSDASCIVAAFFDPANAINPYKADHGGDINVGGYFVGWNGSSTGTCSFGSLTAVTASSSAGVSLYLGTTCVVNGLSGALSYTGSGTVDNCRSIVVQISTGGPSFSNFNAGMVTNGISTPFATTSGNSQRYDIIPNNQYIGGGDPTSYYIRAYYDSNATGGWSNPPSAGEPCKQLTGTFTTSSAQQAGLNITFSDTDSCGN